MADQSEPGHAGAQHRTPMHLPTSPLSPLVSVVVATHNHEAYLRVALESLRAQTQPATTVQVIVVNDGSTDDTATLLNDFAEWAHVVHTARRGLVAACNLGLLLARGSYFVRLDSDDAVHPTWLERLIATMLDNPDAVAAHSDRHELCDGRRTRVRIEPGNLYAMLACGVLMRTDMLRAVGGYRSLFWEERDLFLRLRERGRFVYVPEPLYVYRRHGANMTLNRAARINGWRELLQLWDVETLRDAGRDTDLEELLDEISMDGR